MGFYSAAQRSSYSFHEPPDLVSAGAAFAYNFAAGILRDDRFHLVSSVPINLLLESK